MFSHPRRCELSGFPAEGGHAHFAPRNRTEYEIMEHIKRTTLEDSGKHINRVSIERVTSGLGLPKIYEYLSLKKPGQASPAALADIKSGKDIGQVISVYAKSGKCPICVETMDLFMQAYGAEAGNLCLKTLPFGGLYIAGGIAAKNMDVLRKNDQFVREYLAKGRMKVVLDRIPIYLITHKAVGLLGSKVICRRIINGPLQIRSKL